MSNLADTANEIIEDAQEQEFLAEQESTVPDDYYANLPEEPLLFWKAPAGQGTVLTDDRRVAAYLDNANQDYLCPSCGWERMPSAVMAQFSYTGLTPRYDGEPIDEGDDKESCAICSAPLWSYAGGETR